MRVLLLLEYPSLNGGENSLLSVIPTLRAQGVELIAAAPPSGPLALALRAAGIPPVRWDGRAAAGTQSARRAELEQLLHQIRPDLVHTNSLSMARLAGPVCQSRPVPGLGYLRDILRPSRAALTDLACQSRLIAVSHATRDWYLSLGLPAEIVHVVYNGVDLERFADRAPTGYLHRELGLAIDKPLIASIGQLGIRKGTDLLLHALHRLLPHHPELHCLIIGQRHSNKAESRQYERDLHRLSQSPPLAEKVHFLGRREDIPQLLNELSVLVHLARQEPLGRVLLEAAATGCCIVATRVGGTEEIFPRASSAACLVDAESPAEAARAIDHLLRESATRRRIGVAARRRVESTFGNMQAGRALFRHYQQLTGGSMTTDPSKLQGQNAARMRFENRSTKRANP